MALDGVGFLDTSAHIPDASESTISQLTGADICVHAEKLQGKAWTLSELRVC